jgi:hypothetical protein
LYRNDQTPTTSVFAEQDAADQRDVGQAGDVQMRRRCDSFTDEAGADQAG